MNLGQAGVVCFFLISGFVIPYSLQSHGSLLKYAISRFFRIFPLYWFVLAVTWMLVGWKTPGLDLGPGDTLTWRSLIVHVFMIQSAFHVPNLVGISWTLVIEIVFYFVTVFVFLMRPASLARFIAVLCALTLGGAWLGWHFHKSLPIYPVVLILTAFAGQAIEYAWSGKMPKIRAAILFGVVLLTCLLSIHLREAVNSFNIDARTISTSWGVGYAVFLIFLTTHWQSRVLTFLGRISYSVYLLHPLFIAFFFSRFGPSWVIFWACFIVACGVSAATFTFIEQPGIDLGKNLFRRILLNSAAA